MVGPNPLRMIVPPELRFQSVDGKHLVQALADHYELEVVWLDNNAGAILERGSSDAQIKQILADLKSTDSATRRQAAWSAGWCEDVRVIDPLLDAAGDPAMTSLAAKALYRLDLDVVTLFAAKKMLSVNALVCASLLTDGSPRVRECALTHLDAKTPDDQAVLEHYATESIPTVPPQRDDMPRIDSDRAERLNAAGMLAQVGNEKGWALLEQSLTAKDMNTRQGVLWNLAGTDSDRARILLRKQLADPDAKVRILTVQMLGQRRSAKALPLLTLALADTDDKIRVAAVIALQAIDDDRARALLAKLVDDKSEVVRKLAAAGAKRAAPSPFIMPDPAQPDAAQRRATVLAAVDKALADPNDPQRDAAVDCLAHLGGDWALSRLAKILADPNDQERCAAAIAIGNIGGDPAVALLAKALVGNDDRLRYWAVEGLGNSGSVKAVSVLEQILNTPDDGERDDAVSALESIGGKDALAVMPWGFADDDSFLCRHTAAAITIVGGHRSLPLFQKELKHSSETVRAAVVGALGFVGGPEAFPLLKTALTDPNTRMRAGADESLARMGSDRARDLLLAQWKVESQGNLRNWIRDTLQRQWGQDPIVQKALAQVPDQDPANPTTSDAVVPTVEP
ncbi:MAG: HEAT repeat domain-containing protein [Planctomycetota bacterium]